MNLKLGFNLTTFIIIVALYALIVSVYWGGQASNSGVPGTITGVTT